MAAAMAVRAATEVVDGITWTYTVSGGKASVGGGSSSSTAVPKTTSGAITIPSTLGGYPVTSIRDYAFQDCSHLTSVMIPNGVTSIGEYAFRYCYSSLTSVTIPDSMTSIGKCAFYYCSGLTSVTIPDSVTSLGSSAFDNCIKLKTVIIGNRVTSIGERTFGSCSSLESVTIPDSVTSIGYGVFQGCSSLTSIMIPDSVTSISESAFYACGKLQSVTIGDGVTSIGKHAFYACGLRSVTIGSGVTSLGYEAFQGCSAYKLVLKSSTVSLNSLKEASLGGVYKVYCPRVISFNVAIAVGGMEKIAGFTDGTIFSAEIVSTKMRASDPTVMDITYIVHNDADTVNVRALAFENGERGFATVVRPETFIEGTDANIGDGIAANVEHRLSWKVSSDWATDLAKAKVEVLAMKPGELLPSMHFVTIPAAEGHPKTIASVNDLSVYRPLLFDALLWFYASGESDLSLSNGDLSSAGIVLCRNASVDANALGYLFGKIGYRRLSGSELAWVNKNTRLRLTPQEFRQYAVKTVEE